MSERTKRTRAGGMRAMLIAGMIAGAGLLSPAALAQSSKKSDSSKTAGAVTQDVLIFRNGTTLTGSIVSETETSIKFKSQVSGIDFETSYSKSDILDIKRAPKKTDGKGGKEPAPAKADPAAGLASLAKASEAKNDDGRTGPKYYYVKLTGDFGGEISQTPLKEVVDDAHANGAETLIFELDASWKSRMPGGGDEEAKQFEQSFGAIFRAVPVNDVFVKYIPSVYGDSDRPKVVFWIKNAMGGAAFVPMVSCERYFAPEGKWGGIGDLSTMHPGSSERVKEKWRAASLQTAQGFGNWGCVPELVLLGMSRYETVLSVRYVDGKPEFFEGYPTNPGEELLTDDGTKDSEKDTIEQLARFEGNDVLLLTAEKAAKLQLSRGTVDSREELLDRLDLTLAGRAVDARAERILKNWSDSIERAKATLVKNIREYRDIRVEGTWEERRAARGKQLRLLDQMISLVRNYGEGLLPRWCVQNGVPLTDEGQPDINGYLNSKDRIKTEQQLDKRR